ncbi:MAG: MATE family efflux transporter [Bacteroidia bacterium]
MSNRKDLTAGSVQSNLIRLTLPMLVGIFSMVAFNLIDTFYVGKLGKDELAALSFTFPVITLIFSLIQGIGMGATALISKSIGKNDLQKAKRETSDSLMLGLILAGIFSAIGFFTIRPVFSLLGAEGHILELIEDYMSIWYFTIVFVVIPFVGNSAIRATGDANTPAMIMIFAVVINAILDPLLIFGIGPFPALGLKGAALATSISRAITLFVSLYILYFREKLITFDIPPMNVLKSCWGAVLYIGIPSGFSRMLGPIGIAIVTATIAQFGESSVAAFGVGSRIEFLFMTILIALAASFGPFTGQNLGAGKIERVEEALKKAGSFSLLWSISMAVVLFFFGKTLASVFSENAEVIENTGLYLSIVPLAFGFQGIAQTVNSILNTIKKPMHASALILFTMVGLVVPMVKLGANFYGLQGIFAALAISYFIGGSTAYVLCRRWLSKPEFIQGQ